MLEDIARLPALAHTILGCGLGLLVGSFLNVVIFRYPNLLKYQWTAQSHEWINDNSYEGEKPPGIVRPASHCGNCKQPIAAWQNVPLLSYLFLRGKCANCKTSISIRYPGVELLTGLMSAYVVHHFGWSAQAAFSMILTWVLVALSFIDFDHQLLPDDLVLPTLWLGLGLSTWSIFTTPESAIIGAILGYMTLWSVFQIFKKLTGKDGMGYGDFKLLALFGAWLGWQALPQIILISAVLGSLVGLTLIMLKKASPENAIPFGPYLAIAGWIALLWGDEINSVYLRSAGFS